MPATAPAARIEKILRPSVLQQPVYEPGRPIDEVARELGLDPETVLKLASNENPFGPAPKALEAARRALTGVHLYPDGGAYHLRGALAARHALAPDQILPGNGSNELIELVGHAFLSPGDEVVMGERAFIVYKLVTLLFGARPVEAPLRDHRHDLEAMRAAVTERTRVVFLPSPNNPTGTANDPEEILAWAAGLPEEVLLVFDEAYAEYLDRPADLRPLIKEGRLVLCLRTFSKIFGLAGFRLGYGYGPKELIAALNRVRQPFNTNAVAQAAALGALEDEAFLRRCREANRAGLDQLGEGLDRLGLETIPSVANFIAVKVGPARQVFEGLQRAGIIVRPLVGYGMAEWLRVSVGAEQENLRLLEVLPRVLGGVRG